ncbi:MAG: diguanylate cyclase [Capsulimonadaceae bacterium]
MQSHVTTGSCERPDAQNAQEVLDLLVRSGDWLVWSCIVRPPQDDVPWWAWNFQDDLWDYFPEWFDLDRFGDENLAVTLGRQRMEDDGQHCDETALQALINGAVGYDQTFRVELRDGRVTWVEEHVTIKPIADQCWHVVGVCLDATDRKLEEMRMIMLNEEMQAMQYELETQNDELLKLREKLIAEKAALAEANLRLEALATIDGLTGIQNHRAFQEQLEHDWHAAVREGRPLSLILIDVDHFKQFNDAYGHPEGDTVLKRVAMILDEQAREGDCIARYGGEEFVVILPETRLNEAAEIAERIRVAVEHYGWMDRRITASLGVAVSYPPELSPQELIESADRAMYQAKAAGRNCVCTGNNRMYDGAQAASRAHTRPREYAGDYEVHASPGSGNGVRSILDEL